VALGNYLQARFCHSGGVDGPSAEEVTALSRVAATILSHSRHFGAQLVQAAMRTMTEAMHMAPAQFAAVQEGGMPLAFINFLQQGAPPTYGPVPVLPSPPLHSTLYPTCVLRPGCFPARAAGAASNGGPARVVTPRAPRRRALCRTNIYRCAVLFQCSNLTVSSIYRCSAGRKYHPGRAGCCRGTVPL
jgi:hypothetical protein